MTFFVFFSRPCETTFSAPESVNFKVAVRGCEGGVTRGCERGVNVRDHRLDRAKVIENYAIVEKFYIVRKFLYFSRIT